MIRIVAVLLLTAAVAAGAQVLEPIFHAPPADVEVLRLENGLEVVLMPNPAQPMVGIYCAVKVGSAWEDYATSGMSHMLEHLLFNGTVRYTQEELYAAADRAGAYNNAHTSDFFTNYMMVLPGENLATGLELQSQMLFHSLLPDDKFEKERGIVLGEIAQSLDRERFAEDALTDLLYGGTSLALPTLGTGATIAAMSRDEVFDFYKRWYVPNNMVLTLAGGFGRDEALALIREHYGAVAPRTLPRVDLGGLPPIETTVTVVRRGGTQRKLSLVFEAPVYGSVDQIAFETALELLAADGTGALQRALEEWPPAERPRLGWWWQAAPGFGRLVLDFTLPAGFAPERAYGVVQNAVSGVLDRGVQPESLQEAVAMARTRTLKQREQLRMTGIYLAGPLVQGGPDHVLSYLPRLAAVTSEQVIDALRHWVLDRPCQALLVEPAVVPQAPAAMGAAAAATGDADRATPIERTVLPSGAVLVSQQSPGSELMAIHLTVRGRSLLDQRYGHPGALNLVHRLLTYGISGCDETCLAGRLRRLGAEVKLVDDPRIPMDDYYTTGRFSFIRIECLAENAREVLALLAQISQFSTFGAADLEREREAQRQLLQRREGTAGWQASRQLAEALYGAHPLALPVEGTAATLADISYDALRSLYRRAFQPDNLILAIVSPYAQADLVTLLPDLPGGGGQPGEALPPLPVTTAPTRRTATIGGPMGTVRAGAIRAIDPADADALEMLGAVLSDRLAMDLRETRGLSYSVGASLQADGDRGIFVTWVNPPAARLAEGEQALMDFLREFDPATLTQDELDTVRNARQGRLLMRRLDSISRAYQLAMAELGGDVTEYLRALTAPRQVTLHDLQRVAALFFSELPLAVVVVE